MCAPPARRRCVAAAQPLLVRRYAAGALRGQQRPRRATVAPPFHRPCATIAPPQRRRDAGATPTLRRHYVAAMSPPSHRYTAVAPTLRYHGDHHFVFRQGCLQRYHSHDCQQHCRRRRCPHYIAVCRRYADSTPPLRRPSAAFLCRCYPPPQAANVVAMADDIAIVLIPLFPSSSLNVLRAPRLGHRCAAA